MEFPHKSHLSLQIMDDLCGTPVTTQKLHPIQFQRTFSHSTVIHQQIPRENCRLGKECNKKSTELESEGCSFDRLRLVRPTKFNHVLQGQPVGVIDALGRFTDCLLRKMIMLYLRRVETLHVYWFDSGNTSWIEWFFVYHVSKLQLCWLKILTSAHFPSGFIKGNNSQGDGPHDHEDCQLRP